MPTYDEKGALLVKYEPHTLDDHSEKKLDQLDEKTPDAGVTVDLCLIKDGKAAKAGDLAIASQVAGDILYFDGTNWIKLAKDANKYLKSGASAPAWDEATIGFSFAIPIDTPETVGTDKGVFHFAPGVAGTIEEVYIMAKTAPGADKTLTVDVNKGGTTIFTTQGNRPSLTGTNKTATSGAPDVAAFVKNDLFTIDVDVSTAETAVADVIVFIRGKQKVA